MKKLLIYTGLCLLLLAAHSSYAQSDKELAKEKARKGIRLEDEEGKVDEAIKLFEEAQKLDPDNIAYPFEIALAYMVKKEYKKSETLLLELLKRKEPPVEIYQTLGNVYDYQGRQEEAMKMYDKGLEKFPHSGLLYVEMGNLRLNQKAYEKALYFYEKGIAADPAFPTNYYRAAKLYCSSSEEVWGMIYGELFMNIERNSKRTAEISKLLYDTYKSEITFKGDSVGAVSFSKMNTINAEDLKDPKKFKPPFGMACYEMIMALSVAGEKQIDPASLNRIRNTFVSNYFSSGSNTKYPNLLFDYQKKVKDAGHIEAYNHWVLMKGDEDAFDQWHAGNKAKWDAFLKWFGANQMIVDDTHKFSRFQY